MKEAVVYTDSAAPADVDFRVTFEERDDVMVEGRAVVIGGIVAFRSFAVRAEDDLTAATLRAIPVGEIRRQVQQMLAPARPSAPSPPRDRRVVIAGGHSRSGWVEFVETDGRFERVEADDRDAAVAELYLESVRDHPRNPIEALSALMGQPRGRVSELVRRARDRGWLTARGRGKAGAEPGPRLLVYRETRETKGDSL